MSDRSRFVHIICISVPIFTVLLVVNSRMEDGLATTLHSAGISYARAIVGKLSGVLNANESSDNLAANNYRLKAQLPPFCNDNTSSTPNFNISDYDFDHSKRNCSALMSVLLYTPARGLGNNMFAYASMLGISSDCGRRMCPYVANQELSHLLSVFNGLSVPTFPDFIRNKIDVAMEKYVRTYMPPDKRQLNCSQNYLLMEFYQSWKYFHPKFRDLLKYRDYSFKPQTIESAKAYRDGIIKSALAKHQLNTSVYYEFVAIHIRMWPDFFTKGGHLPTSHDCLQRGLERIRNDFDQYSRSCHPDKTNRILIYLFMSGDMLLGRDPTGNFSLPNLGWKEEFVMRIQSDRAIDLQILALSDRIYLSASGSTFGWWGAYLSDAKKVYYNRQWAVFNSSGYTELNPTDYFLPQWISV